ncbi:MAG: hydrogen peroxide-inducible genes activator, partial [Proteobacteria bacterium]|nr:hydrogen peroxide-inducible genes activator [Pseudomonadota bacterium]
PTLSAQLAKLEEALDVVLFDRLVQPIVPTKRGVEIIAQARVVVSEFKKIQAIAAESSKEVSGDLHIGIIPTVAPYLVPLFLETLSTSYPKLKIEIQELTTKEIIAALDHETIDVGILAIPIDGISFTTEALYNEPFYLYVSKSHELSKLKTASARDIDGKDLWLLEEGHCLRGQILQACNLKGRKAALPNVRFESGSVETLKRLVVQGLGYTLVPHLSLDLEGDFEQDVKIIGFVEPVPSRTIGLMHRRTVLKEGALGALSESIKKNLPRSLVNSGKNSKTIPVKG